MAEDNRGPRGFQGERGPTGLTGPQGPKGEAADPLTASEVKTLYETNSDTNAFTNNEKQKVADSMTESNIQILVRDARRDALEAFTGGRCTVVYNDKSEPNYMFVLSAFSYEDLGFATELGLGRATAFTVAGVDVPEMLIGMYPSSKVNGRAVSQPGREPWARITWDDAIAECAKNGTGWHMWTIHEQAALAYWCAADGIMPRGNTDYGRAHDATWEHGQRFDGYLPGNSSDGNGMTLTGTGPLSWRHTGDATGIADIIGNVNQWVHGMKTVDGEIFVTTDNFYNQLDSEWPTSSRFYRNDKSPSPMLSDSADAAGSYKNILWNDLVGEDGNYTSSELLRRTVIEHSDIDLQGRIYINTAGERFPVRCGHRSRGGRAGLGLLSLGGGRSLRGDSRSFRLAFEP